MRNIQKIREIFSFKQPFLTALEDLRMRARFVERKEEKDKQMP
jgi:hypothetical protein